MEQVGFKSGLKKMRER